MAAEDFEAQFRKLGLAQLPAHATVESTFASGEHDVTVLSPSRDEADFEGTLGTLPRLSLAMPDAALTGGKDAELVAVRVLGEGGMGRVLLAEQQSLGRQVAVKVLKPGSASEAGAAALVEEARTTGSLEHPGVVPVYALARDSNGLPALVMKRVDGVSWRTLIHDPQHAANARIARGGDRLEAHLEVLIQICNAVAHAHRRGVIHRDLKPANVLIGELGEVYVADWGVAIQKAAQKPGPPRLVGTPAYLAPEMVSGDAMLTDERTDVYLLGGMLHEVLTRSPTHIGTTIHDVLERAWKAEPPHLPEVAPELAQVCQKALAADPRARHQTALELREALRLFLRHRGSNRIADAASARLNQLEALAAASVTTTGDERTWYGLVSECRFGFRQALDADPNNAVAHDGLERCLAVATRRELDRGSTDAARAFLTEMKDAPKALRDALAALVARDAERAAEAARLTRDAHERDPMVSKRQRDRVMASVIAALALVIGTLVLPTPIRAWTQDVFGKWHRIVPMTIIVGVFFAALGFGRHALLATRINRQLMALMGIGAAAIWLGRIVYAWLDLPVRIAVAHDAISLAALAAVSAWQMHWSFSVSAGVFLLAGVAALFVPEPYAVATFSVIVMVGLIATFGMFRSWMRALERKA